MYEIKFTVRPKRDLDQLRMELLDLIDKSRFTCYFDLDPRTKKSRLSQSGFYYGSIQVYKVRLKESKPYCGNHSGPCLLTFHVPKRRHKYLEGADWVEFNDLINDFLDESRLFAIVESSAVRVRLNDKRRTYYAGSARGEWDKYGDYEDYSCCFKDLVRSDFAKGTPGIYKEDYYVVG